MLKVKVFKVNSILLHLLSTELIVVKPILYKSQSILLTLKMKSGSTKSDLLFNSSLKRILPDLVKMGPHRLFKTNDVVS